MKLVASFEKFMLLHIPREQNEKADKLSKLASTQRGGNNRLLIHEKISRPIVEEQGVHWVEARKTWMDPLLEYFKKDTISEDADLTRRLMREASKYILVEI
ncbi:hypothetical protein CR513_03796, partial [Mucuna pruriens]